MFWIIAGVVYVTILVFMLACCRAAKRADKQAEKMFDEYTKNDVKMTNNLYPNHR